MTNELQSLTARYESAAMILSLLSEMDDGSPAHVERHQAALLKCRCLRNQLNALVPEWEHDPLYGNIVACIR